MLVLLESVTAYKNGGNAPSQSYRSIQIYVDSARLWETSQFAFLVSSSSSHPAGLGMFEPVEPIKQNELASAMIVHLQLSSQCRGYEPPGL